MTEKNREVSAAIDLGTSYSGYAFSFKQDPGKVYLNEPWRYGKHVLDSGLCEGGTFKAPTCLLLNPSYQLKGFGFDAIRKYQHLVDKNRQAKWMFFRNYKPELNGQVSHEDALIQDVNGQTMNIVRVISLTIGYLKDHMMDSIRCYWPNATDKDVTFVITVPSMWNDSAKRLMRIAVTKAGICGDQMVLCTELEAASLYVQNLQHPICPEANSRTLRSVPSICQDNDTQILQSGRLICQDSDTRTMRPRPPVSLNRDDRTMRPRPPVSLNRDDRTLQPRAPVYQHSDARISQRPIWQDSYFLVDIGGGTVDIAVYQKQENGSFKELLHSCSGSQSTDAVVMEFFAILTEIVGKSVMRVFLSDCTEDYLSLLYEFEMLKTTIQPSGSHTAELALPSSLMMLYEKMTNKRFKCAFDNSDFSSHIKWTKNRLLINPAFLRHCYSKLIQITLSILEEMIEKTEGSQVKCIILVGGNSGSPFFRTAFSHHFDSTFTVFTPSDPDTVLLKGAVLFGQRSDRISSRLVAHTYGTDIHPRFDSRFHPKPRRILNGGVYRCKDIFDILIRAGSRVQCGYTVRRTYAPTSTRQSHMVFNLYAAKEDSPIFVTSRNCYKVGSLSVDLPKFNGQRRDVDFTLVVENTELVITVTNNVSKSSCHAKFPLMEI